MNRPCCTEINLLIFSVGGVVFAMDAAQAQKTSSYHGEEAEDLFFFHKEFGFGYREITYQAPAVITIKTMDGPPYRIIIDSMEEISEFSLKNLRPFPPLLEPFTLRNGMWGILHRNGKMVLLVDFERIIRNKADQLIGTKTPHNNFNHYDKPGDPQ